MESSNTPQQKPENKQDRHSVGEVGVPVNLLHAKIKMIRNGQRPSSWQV
jgi:hypothetical protein